MTDNHGQPHYVGDDCPGGHHVVVHHTCCEHAVQAHADAERAWATVDEFQRRLLIIANAVRGTDRYLNGRKHIGQSVNRSTVPTANGSRPDPKGEGDQYLSSTNSGRPNA